MLKHSAAPDFEDSAVPRRQTHQQRYLVSPPTYYVQYYYATVMNCGLGSSVGIATDYRLDGPGIESRWGEIFRPSRMALRPTQPPVQQVPGLSRG